MTHVFEEIVTVSLLETNVEEVIKGYSVLLNRKEDKLDTFVIQILKTTDGKYW